VTAFPGTSGRNDRCRLTMGAETHDEDAYRTYEGGCCGLHGWRCCRAASRRRSSAPVGNEYAERAECHHEERKHCLPRRTSAVSEAGRSSGGLLAVARGTMRRLLRRSNLVEPGQCPRLLRGVFRLYRCGGRVGNRNLCRRDVRASVQRPVPDASTLAGPPIVQYPGELRRVPSLAGLGSDLIWGPHRHPWAAFT
jgi:hypothetical protein